MANGDDTTMQNGDDLTAPQNGDLVPTPGISLSGPWGQLQFDPPATYFAPVGSGGIQGALATVTVTTDEAPAEAENEIPLPTRFRAILGFEGYPADGDSGRKRVMMRGSLEPRPMPLTFFLQLAEAEGHMGKVPVGTITELTKIPVPEFAVEGFELPPDISDEDFVVWGEGDWDLASDRGREAARLTRDKIMRGVSMDLAGTEWVPLDPDTLEELDPEEMSLEDLLMGTHYVGAKKAAVSGATIVAEPAFGYAMVASGVVADWSQIEVVYDDDTFVACAAGPLKPPAAWFERKKFTKLTPFTVTDEGECFGHVGTFDCHMGNDERCFRAPRGGDYLRFHSGTLVTAEGEHVKVGRITVKEHAPFRATPDQVLSHYSDPNRVGAFVVLWEDEFGYAVHGTTRSDAPPSLLRDLYANPPSPDWRRRELLGISTVPLPGLPVVDPVAVMTASAAGLAEVDVLILPPLADEDFVEEATEVDAMVAAAVLEGDDALLDMIVG